MTPNEKKTPRKLNEQQLSTVTGGTDPLWLEETGGEKTPEEETSAWYGLENPAGVFKPGSRFHVRWTAEHEGGDQ